MVKQSAWEARLNAVISYHAGIPFSWGESDCILLGLDAFDAVWGTDLASRVRGHYDSENSAARFMLREFGSMRTGLSAELGEPVSVNLAQRGDILILHQDGREAGGICVGADGMCKTQDGVGLFPLGRFAHCWKGGKSCPQ